MTVEVGETWSSSLSRVGANLSHVSEKLQDYYEDLSSNNVTNGGRPIPDPVDLLRRIQALEVATQRIQLECKELTERKAVVVLEVTDLLSTNSAALKKLSRHIGHVQNESSHNWKNLKEKMEHQCETLMTSAEAEISEIHSIDSYNKDISETKLDDEEIETMIPAKRHPNNMVITNQMLSSLSPEIRGSAKLDHILKILKLIHEEYTARFMNGYKGKDLAIERYHLLKHRNPDLHTVISNTSTWRDVISVLKSLGFIKVKKDGLLYVSRPDK